MLAEVNFSQKWRSTEHAHDLLFVISKVGLSFGPLILDRNFIVEASGKLFSREGSEILLLTVDHKEDLPGVSIFGDPSELGAAEVVDVDALEYFFVWHYDKVSCSLSAENIYQSPALFQYRY